MPLPIKEQGRAPWKNISIQFNGNKVDGAFLLFQKTRAQKLVKTCSRTGTSLKLLPLVKSEHAKQNDDNGLEGKF